MWKYAMMKRVVFKPIALCPRWWLDQRVVAAREAPLKVNYESLGTYYNIYFYDIYRQYLIVRCLLS